MAVREPSPPAGPTTPSARQAVFEDLVRGTLLYAVVLGFFADYTDILSTTSYSTTFMLAAVMQILTMLTLAFKGRVAGWFRQREGVRSKVGLGFSIWLIMFLSKFVFLAVIDWVFGSSVELNGFFGILILIAVMMLAQQVWDRLYILLGR